MAKQKVGRKGKGRRSSHNKETGKYVKQFARTEANLKRKGKTNKKLK